MIHSHRMSKPAESSFSEYVIHTALTSSDSDLFVCYSVLPGYDQPRCSFAMNIILLYTLLNYMFACVADSSEGLWLSAAPYQMASLIPSSFGCMRRLHCTMAFSDPASPTTTVVAGSAALPVCQFIGVTNKFCLFKTEMALTEPREVWGYMSTLFEISIEIVGWGGGEGGIVSYIVVNNSQENW